jgi:hypothetical protein
VLLREYPREAVAKAVATALQYGLFDLERLERLILRTIAKDYFLLPGGPDTATTMNDGIEQSSGTST